MLKITITETAAEKRWTLQGQLAGPAISELSLSWAGAQENRQGRRCTIDLDDVTFIDEEGEDLLSKMISEGAEPFANGVYTRQVLKDLRSRKKRRMCRFLGRSFTLVLSLGLTLGACLIGPGSTALRDLRAQTRTSRPESAIASSVSSILAAQSSYLGSVPQGKASNASLPISIRDAVERGLKFNLGLIQSDLDTVVSHSDRLERLSDLLPHVHASLSQTLEQINLEAQGINIHIPGIPTVVGPFGVQDAGVELSQKIFDWSAVQELRASDEGVKASRLSYRNSRDIVALAVGNAYLEVISDRAAVTSQKAQVETSQALYQRAVDQKKAGVAARIDELRAQVELHTQQQRLIAASNQMAKDKLGLGRIIGLPPGQDFTLTDSVPYAPLEHIAFEKALEDAYANRADYQSAEALLRQAEYSRKAAVAERYPSLSSSLAYGDIGPNFGSSHGSFVIAGTLRIPIFQGGRVRADIQRADAQLRRRQAEAENLRARIDDEVRAAFLDLRSADDLVSVAKGNVALADETLAQARDRFVAGVADNIEVIQAQESVASANNAYISSLYTFNIAKIELARAAGLAEQSVVAYLGGK